MRKYDNIGKDFLYDKGDKRKSRRRTIVLQFVFSAADSLFCNDLVRKCGERYVRIAINVGMTATKSERSIDYI